MGFLSSVAALQGLEQPVLEFLASASVVKRCVAGAVLFRQGDRSDSIYVVVSGTLQVESAVAGGNQQRLALLNSGDWIGETGLFLGKLRSATVSACSDAELLEFSESTLRSLESRYPAAYQRLIEVASRRLLSRHLASVELFAEMDAVALQQFDNDNNWLRLSGGDVLFAQNDPPDYLYVLVEGRLEVVVDHGNGVREVVDQITPTACVGEMAILTNQPRSATVRAVRACELVRLSKEQFEILISQHPAAVVEIARTLVGRLRQTTAREVHKRQISTIAILPAGSARVPPAFITEFLAALSDVGGTTLHLDSHLARQDLGEHWTAAAADQQLPARAMEWLNEREDRFQYVIYEADPTPSAWTDVCIRQADRILLVALAASDPQRGPVESSLSAGKFGEYSSRTELVLLHPNGDKLPVGTGRWLAERRIAGHHHIRLDSREDYRRLARSIIGRAVGVVFGGGGARGYLQVGALQALRDSGIPVDVVGGASIGSLIAAQVALGNDVDRIIEISTTGYGRDLTKNLLRDATLPVMAFLSARKSVEIMKEVYGLTLIEDLWLRFFCVSSNLSRAELVIHEQGPLWLGLRASLSVPGILPPVIVDGEMLVDGGLLNNLPVDIMRGRAGTVIAIDIAAPVELTVSPQTRVTFSGWPLLWRLISPFKKKERLPNIFNILSRAATLSSIHNIAAHRKDADLYLHPLATGVDTLDFTAGRKLIGAGYQHAMAEIEKWKQTGEGHLCKMGMPSQSSA